MKILTAFCDLAYCPVSFDFVTWLVRAMVERDARGCDGLHVVLVPKEDGLGHIAREWGKHTEAATMWRLWHIVIASCPLAGASVTLAASRWQAGQMRGEGANWSVWWPEGKAHFMGPLVESSRAGKLIPKLRATDAARGYVSEWLASLRTDKPIVTMTLRNQTTDPDRNSDPPAWHRFRLWAIDQGVAVIDIEDAHVALSRGRGFAELDPDLRLALYERAKMNLIGNNGPQELLKFSDAPYLAFGQALSKGWQDHFRKYFAMEPGDQLPWARADQRLIYRADSFDVLKEEFERWAWSEQAK